MVSFDEYEDEEGGEEKEEDEPVDAWGEEPAWAQDSAGGEGGDGDEQEGEGSTAKDEASRNTLVGARHVLILIDCAPSMFEPCIRVRDPHKDDEHSQPSQSPSLSQSQSQPMSFHAAEAETSKSSRKRRRISRSSSDKLVSAFDAALLAAEQLLRQRVRYVATSRSGKRDGVGITLFGTKRTRDETSGMGGYTTTHHLLPLAPPGIDHVLKVNRCLPNNRQRDLKQELQETNQHQSHHLAATMGHASLCPLRSALHEANKAFRDARCVKKNAKISDMPADDLKTIWIFTNDDDPCRGNEHEKKQVAVVASDITENGIQIHLWPLPKPQQQPSLQKQQFFHYETFYNQITTKGPLSDDDASIQRHDPYEMDLDDFLTRVGRQWKKVRRAMCLPLRFPSLPHNEESQSTASFTPSKKPCIMLDFYRLVQPQTKPTRVYVHQETNTITLRTTQTLAIDTGEIVPKKHIRTYVQFGADRVVLTPQDILQIKKESRAPQDLSQYLSILGFKPADSREAPPLFHHLDRAYLAYPNEEAAPGSREAFSALYWSMIRRNVISIGELSTSARAVARLVAILPRQEERISLVDDEEGSAHGEAMLQNDDTNIPTEQVQAPGWVVVPLPYRDDLRPITEDTTVAQDEVANQKTIDAAKEIIQNQQLRGMEWGYNFTNPSLAKFWRYVESIALGSEGALSSSGATASASGGDDKEDETTMDTEGILRSAGTQIEAFKNMLPHDVDVKRESKWRPSATKASLLSLDDWRNMYEAGTLAQCTVDTLKAFLRGVGIKTAGRKLDLITKVEEYLESNKSLPGN